MREILFRGKRMDDGEWVEGYLVKAVGGECMILPVTTEHCGGAEFSEGYHCDPTTVGQYTGLKDKNGKRIFEGDICRNTRTGEIVSVKWHGTMAGYVWNKRRADGFLFDFGELFRACDKYEVIGNIHDNPEMLKGGEG